MSLWGGVGRLLCHGLNDKYMLLVIGVRFYWLSRGSLSLPALFYLSLKMLAGNVVIYLGCLLCLVRVFTVPSLHPFFLDVETLWSLTFLTFFLPSVFHSYISF